jgi:ceramide glucosyltransferase
MHFSFLYLAWLFAILAICGLGYQFLVIAGIVKFSRWSNSQPASKGTVLEWDAALSDAALPPISILKPLCGADPRMYEAFRSHYLQDYPEFEILFGVADVNDPAVAEVERLQREFPSRRIQLLVCPELLGTNRKVSTLVQLLPQARYDWLLINDSDILVPPDYLRRLAACFEDGRKTGRRTGLVTALYRAAANPDQPTTGTTLASRLEALTISTDFAGEVLSSYALEGRLTFGLGNPGGAARSAGGDRRPASAAGLPGG